MSVETAHERDRLAEQLAAVEALADWCEDKGDAVRAVGVMLRRRLSDPGTALARVRAETWAEALRGQRDFFRSIDMPAAADHCEQSAIGWDSAVHDIERAAGLRAGVES